MYQSVLLFRTSSNFWFQKMGMLFFFGFPILLVKPCSLQGQGEIYVMTNLTERAKRWLSNGEFAIDPHDFWGSKTFQFGEICWFDSHKTNDEFNWDPPQPAKVVLWWRVAATLGNRSLWGARCHRGDACFIRAVAAGWCGYNRGHLLTSDIWNTFGGSTNS